jgi:glucokinase
MTESNVCAGIDLGGTKIAVLLGRRDGEIVAYEKIETRAEDGPEQGFQRVASLLQKLSAQSGTSFDAIGLGVPGLADPRSGMIAFLPNLPGSWTGFPAGRYLSDLTGRAVHVMNDARLAAMGEFYFGSETPKPDLLVVTIGTGIGGGLILDGKLRLGECGAAGEIGHHTILPYGVACSCGSNGCLETLINGRQLIAEGIDLARKGQAPHLVELVTGNLEEISPREMACAAEQGDTQVGVVIETAARYLGIGIANAVSITAVPEVVLCGGVALLGDLLLKPVREEIQKRVRMFPASHVRISCSILGEKVGALGALALAFHPLCSENGTGQESESIP